MNVSNVREGDELTYDCIVGNGKSIQKCHVFLGGGFKYFLFSPLFGEDSHFD